MWELNKEVGTKDEWKEEDRGRGRDAQMAPVDSSGGQC